MKTYQVINLKKYLANKDLLGGNSVDDPNHLVIPEGTTEITEDMVPKTTTSVTIPNSVTTIGPRAFGNTLLTSVTIPNSVTSIGEYAFANTQLTSVTIPDSVTTIRYAAFAYTQLTSVTIPDSVTKIGNYAFYKTKLTSVTIPDSVTEIGNYVFDITQLTSVTIPNSVTSIGARAFAGTPLTSVTIPNSVTSIGADAFSGTQLTSVTIPDSVTNLDDTAFDSLVTIIRGSTTEPTDDPNHLNIPEGTTVITPEMVPNKEITSVTIPNSVTTIDDGAFAGTRLSTVTIPNSVITIGNGAFFRTEITNITIPNSVTSIGEYAFAVTRLSTVTIPDSVTSIGKHAFTDTGITNVNIPDSVTNLSDEAFDSNVTIIRGSDSSTASNSPSITDSTLTIERFIRQLPNLTDKKTVEIDRNNLLGSILHNNEIFNEDVYIKFIGETGIDCGGLKREFFTLLGDELIKKYFFEDEGNYCIIKNEDEDGEATIPVDDYYFIGQLFAYAIIVKANINIKLHPVLLHMILNSTYDNPTIDIKNTNGPEILSLINCSSDHIKLNLILEYINKELKYQDRKITNMDSLQEIKEIMDTYDSTITRRMPLGRFFTIFNMSEEQWGSIGVEKNICLEEAGMFCVIFANTLEIPFEKKEWFINFIIRSYIYGKTLEETENFIRGFHNIIKPELLRGLSPKDLNILIAGNSNIDIDMFLAGVDFVNTGDKLEIIQQIIREYASEDPTYLNKFLYWITGKETLPHDGFTEFGRQLQVRFLPEYKLDQGKIGSHTCSDFVYTELPNNLLVDDDSGQNTANDKLKLALSKVMIETYSQGGYNQVGGSNNIIQLKNFIF